MTAVAQIVDAFGPSGTVLLDLNAFASNGGVMLGARDQLNLGDVALNAATAPITWTRPDPEQIVSRKIVVPLVLVAANADALAAQVQRLTGLVTSPFLLKVQRHGASTPVWLRCYPTVPKWTRTSITGADVGTTLAVGTLEAQTEPHALGARVDAGPFTITQNPATAGFWYCDVTGVGGDSLTPAVLRFGSSTITNYADRVHISTRRRGIPANLSGLVVQAETLASSWTTGPTQSVPTGDATLSNGSSVKLTWTTGGLGHQLLLTGSFPLSGVEAVGTYRMLVRLRRSGGASGQIFSLFATVGPQVMREAFTAGGNDMRVIDLGLVQVPTGHAPYMAAPETPLSAAGPNFSLSLGKQYTGAGAIEVDWIGLVPADADAGVLETSPPLPGSAVIALDGYDSNPRIYTTDPYTGVNPIAQGTSTTVFIGGAPRLRPGDNRLYFVGGLGSVATYERPVTDTFTVGVSYWPRFGWLG